MPLIKDGRLVDDAATVPGLEMVDLERWRAEGDEIVKSNHPLGLSVRPDDGLDDVASELDTFQLITVDFPAFTDGRAYSLARLIRERHGYRGELRAVGNVLRDQLQFMRRCGFDAYEVPETAAVDWVEALSEMSLHYQPSGGDEVGTVTDLRRHRFAVARRAGELGTRYGDLAGTELLRPMIEKEFPGKIAVVSSFGAEAAVLLGMVASIDPTTPVVFLETGKHFPETLAHRDALIERFGLTDVRSIAPEPVDLGKEDVDGELWRMNPDRCCHLRKVLPLQRALGGFDAWITGRKRYQTAGREELPVIETDGARIKINPLTDWSYGDSMDWMEANNLPVHPLVEFGFLSIGCAPCTEKALDGDDIRSGRWTGQEKTECGIHRASWAR
jgi:phosphoadenylyl-sulfate reductase (thioredoxin)